ncbi:MAG: hypothetical protein D6822_05370 [Cyanobacteria bacterium J149]|nr:MAG: hypothetical protein D6822_05370 [Cyanobacteria bacterium J149]
MTYFYLGSNTTDQCTLTPGVVIDKEDNINHETLFPKSISQTSRVGTVISQENLNFIRQPGFQRGIEGQEIGIDLYIPNAGAVFGNSISRQTTIRRQEEIDVLPAGSFSTIEQIVKVNHEKAVLGRTVRGIPVIPEGEEPWLYTLSSGASFLLPTIDPKLEGSDKPVDPRANRNLFLASNNARLPPASFVVYQIGVGEADTPKSEVEELSQLPSAMYNSIWFGFSPDVRISLHNRSYLEILGSERLIESAGGEGGVADFSNINSIVSFSNQIINPDDLSRFYVQAYARFFTTEVNAINQTIIDEDTIYAPHISFTGNLTYTDRVFRYYLGTIFSDDVRSYLGADYNQNLSNDLDLNIGAIGYINPNREYYSQTWGSITKNFPLSDNQNSAQAGQGGLAAAVSFTVDSNQNVNGVAAAVGIGKTDAAASAFFETDGSTFNGSAAALGSSSPITIDEINAIDINFIESSGDRGDRDLDTAQENEIDGLALIASNGDLIGGGVITFGSVIDAFTGGGALPPEL